MHLQYLASTIQHEMCNALRPYHHRRHHFLQQHSFHRSEHPLYHQQQYLTAIVSTLVSVAQHQKDVKTADLRTGET